MIADKLKSVLSTAMINSNSTTRYHTHIGGSLLSDECMRRSAYRYRWALPIEQHNEKTLRIFELGKVIEQIVLNWLIQASEIELTEKSISDTQEQVNALYGHLCGHMDGIVKIDGKRYIIEIKSHNDASFKQLINKGVEISHPSHYLQCQTYMHFSDIKECLYIAYNKNNSDIYIHHIIYDDNIGSDLEDKAKALLIGNESYPIIEMYKCKKFNGCPYFDLCYNNGTMLQNCRTCISLEPIDNGQWKCQNHDKVISIEDQERGCNEYKQRAF